MSTGRFSEYDSHMQTEVFFDIYVTDTDALSAWTVQTLMTSTEEEKNKKCLDATVAQWAFFTPFVVAVDEIVGRVDNSDLKHVAEALSIWWTKP